MTLRYEGREYEAMEGYSGLAREVRPETKMVSDEHSLPMAYAVVAQEDSLILGIRYKGSWSLMRGNRSFRGDVKLLEYAERTCEVNHTPDELPRIRKSVNALAYRVGKKEEFVSDKKGNVRIKRTTKIAKSLDGITAFKLKLVG